MRVLILDQYSDCGGGQRMLLQTLCAIRERGWNARVALPDTGPLFAEVHSLGFRTAAITCGPFAAGAKSSADSLRFVLQLPRLAGQIARLSARFRPHLLYINGPRLLPATLLSRPLAPVLYHAHIPMPSEALRWLAGIALHELNAEVVAISDSVAPCWRPFARVRVVRNAVPGPSCPQPPRLTGPPRIGCIGRISPEKGQREFLQVAARILDSIPAARFFVYGAPLFGDRAAKQYESELRAAAENMPVDFPGWVDDVYDAFANLDLLLVPSIWPEPNALVILEAFAAGVPVIAFRAGGIPEFLDQLCDAPAQMAAMAVALLNDPQRYQSLIAAGRAAWHQNFQPARYRTEIAAAMHQAAGL